MNKLLILPCTSKKLSGGIYIDQINDHFKNDNLLKYARKLRSNYYLKLLSSNAIKDLKYFEKDRILQHQSSQKVNNVYFNSCFNNNLFYMEAVNRYDGNLYNSLVRNLIFNKTKAGLHVLIISGLYGLLKFDDHIVDYQLDITKGGNKLWKGNQVNSISNALVTYTKNNKISHSDVTVILSKTYSEPLKEVITTFKENLWDKANGYGHNHVPFLIDYLSKIPG